jgi:galactitol-specific phosphotransferase system IIB component
MENLVKVFEEHGYNVKVFDKAKDSVEELIKAIDVTDTIGIGGSSTVLELGIYDILKERGNEVYWHWKSENKKEALENAKNTDVYISSVNAITEDGKIVNMDGTGNRVASMIFGHKQVYLIVGKNKICKNYDAAIERIKTVAAPKNAERLKLNTPCRFTGKCNDCDSPEKMCKAEVILHRKPGGTNINIYFVNEELGY